MTKRTNFPAMRGTGKQVAGILIAGLCAFAVEAAQADCASQCAAAYGGYGSYNYTVCYQLQCTNKKSFGALAFGASSDAYGYAWGKANAGQAQQTAMVDCRAHGDDCKIVANFSNACAAVAAVEDKKRFTVGQGNSRADAQNKAMKSCGSEIGGKCQIEVWTCSTP
jgi:hypothetical protein